MQTATIRRLPSRGSSTPASTIAATAPTGAPSSAKPSVPSLNRRRAFASGTWAVHDAKSSPCATNVAVTATRAHRICPIWTKARAASDTADLDPGRGQCVHCGGWGGRVGDYDVERGQVTHHRERGPAE